MNRSTKIGLFIPTFNVESLLSGVLDQLDEDLLSDFEKIYFVDNGSQDGTLDLIKSWGQKQKIKVEIYQNQTNVFLGGSTAFAFDRALEDRIDYLICMHSDGQASPKDLQQFVLAIGEDQYDFILGSRFIEGADTGNYSKTRWFFNYVFCLLQQTLVKKKVYDMGAFLGFRMETISKLPYKSIPFDMGYHPYLILLASQKMSNIRFKEFPIHWGEVETTNVNVIQYGLVHFSRIVRLHLKMGVNENRKQSFETLQIY